MSEWGVAAAVSPFVVCRSLFVVRRLSFVVCRSSFCRCVFVSRRRVVASSRRCVGCVVASLRRCVAVDVGLPKCRSPFVVRRSSFVVYCLVVVWLVGSVVCVFVRPSLDCTVCSTVRRTLAFLAAVGPRWLRTFVADDAVAATGWWLMCMEM